MNKLVRIAAVLPILTFGAAAQDEDIAKMKQKLDAEKMLTMKMVGAVRGMPVKGAPYSADEITENTQVLADGTRIHRETKTAVYRDSEGRTRRETPESIMISDPVANVSYVLNPKTMTAHKMTMASSGNYFFSRTTSGVPGVGVGGGKETATFTMRTNGAGPTSITVNGQPLDPKTVAEMVAKAKASGEGVTINGPALEREKVVFREGLQGGFHASEEMQAKWKAEPLGKQVIEGVNAEGTRNVTTIETGAVGNDRPIQTSSERWYSEELQTVVMTKHSDPRTGEESFRLMNVRRGEPGAYLFQVPAGYQLAESKQM